MPRRRQPPPERMPSHPTIVAERDHDSDSDDMNTEDDDQFTGQLHKSGMGTRAQTGKKERRSRSRERRPAIEASRQRFAKFQGKDGKKSNPGKNRRSSKKSPKKFSNASSSSSSTPPRQRGSSGGSSSDNISPGRAGRRRSRGKHHSRTPSPGSSRMESARAHALRIRVLHEREEWRQHYPPGWPEYLHTDELVYQLNQLEVVFDAQQPRKKLLRLLVQTARRNAAESAKHHAVHARIHLVQPSEGVQLMPTWAPGSKLVVRVCLVYAGKVEDAVRRSAAASNKVEDVMADYWHTMSQTPSNPDEAAAFSSPFRDALGSGDEDSSSFENRGGGQQWFAVDASPGTGTAFSTAAVPASTTATAPGAGAGTSSTTTAAAPPVAPSGSMAGLNNIIARFDIGQKKDLRVKFELWLKGYLWNTLLGVTEKYLLPLPQYYIGAEAALQETLPIEAPPDNGEGSGGRQGGGGSSFAPERKELARICFSTFFEQLATPTTESPLPSPSIASESLRNRDTRDSNGGASSPAMDMSSGGGSTPRGGKGGKKGKGKKGRGAGMTSKVLLDIADMTIEHESGGSPSSRSRPKRPSGGKNSGGAGSATGWLW